MEAVLSTYTESWEGLEQRRADGTQYWEAEPCVPLLPPRACAPLSRDRRRLALLTAARVVAAAATTAADGPQGPADLR